MQRRPTREPRPPRGKRLRIIIAASIFVFLISITTITTLYTDLLWYREVGFDQVFWRTLSTKLMLGLAFGAAMFVFSAINLLMVGRLMPVYRLVADPRDPLDRYRGAMLPYIRTLALGGSALLALFFALGVTPLWEDFLLFRNSVGFGVTDPVFSRDISFYVFNLPVYRFIYNWAMSALVLITLIVAGAHYLTGGIRPQARTDRVTSQVKAHLSVLIGLIALVRAWGYRLDQFELLYSTRGTVVGASYTDINAELPALTLLVVISIIGAVLFLVNIRFRGWSLPLVGVGLWLLTSVVAAGLFPFLMQRFRVDPAELQRERPFIERNIEATRAAFGIEDIEVKEYPAQRGVSRADIEANRQTLDSVRLWDPDTLKQAYSQLQAITLYYQFVDVDVDRYQIGGETRQLLLSARELDYSNLESPTWQNTHLAFTHGYGAVVSPTNAIGSQGRPEFLVSEVPPQSEVPELEIKEGGVYFGETDWTYSIVNTEQEEIDFSVENQVKTVSYKGEAGVRIDNLLRRAAFAWRFRDANLLISGLIDNDSRILFNRQIRERMEKAAPFLRLDGDPYLVVNEGRLVWMYDAYTISNMYPYSQMVNFEDRTLLRGQTGASFSGTGNYIRNSVKATIDAYDGTMKLYVWDEDDPIIKAWQRALPALFSPAAEMPESLKSHVRYPEDLFRIQSFVYRRYHLTQPASFYQQEDVWVIPRAPGIEEDNESGLVTEMQPYYVLMRLPGSDELDYVLILPMNPKRRPNMVSLLAATSDPDDFGQLMDLRFPRGEQLDGVGQVFARINQDQEISQTRTLLGREGSQVLFGNLLVIPIGNSILYSQPFFVRAEANPIPELKQVILASSEKVVMEPTLEEALAALLGEEVATPDTPSGIPATAEGAIQRALDHLRRAEEALKRGDLAAYQRENEEARKALEGTRVSPSPSPSPN